jgi:hypothetical protein
MKLLKPIPRQPLSRLFKNEESEQSNRTDANSYIAVPRNRRKQDIRKPANMQDTTCLVQRD